MITPSPTKTFQSDTALVIVDAQNDFCPGGSLAVPEGDQVMAPLNRMIELALKKGWALILSMCWHPLVTEHFKKWPVHGVKNTAGAALHPDLQVPQPNAYPWVYLIRKGEDPEVDAYSAFDGYHFGTPLADLLRNMQIKHLYIGGLATDYCVKATALDARKQLFEATLLEDACRAVNLKPDDGENAIGEMEDAGVIISHTQEVIDAAA